MSTSDNSSTSTSEAGVHLKRAYELNDMQAFKEALDECQTAIQLAPDSAESYNLLGVVFDSLGRGKEATNSYEKALSLDPTFVEAQENLEDARKESFPPTYDYKEDRRAIIGGSISALSGALIGAMESSFRELPIVVIDNIVEGIVIGVIVGVLAGVFGTKTDKKLKARDQSELGFWTGNAAYGGAFSALVYNLIYWGGLNGIAVSFIVGGILGTVIGLLIGGILLLIFPFSYS